MQNQPLPENELLFVREFSAPPEMVFDVWIHSEHLQQWWGPNGFTITTKPMKATTGLSWSFTMHGPDGRDYPNRIVFSEVNRPFTISYKHDDDGTSDAPAFDVRLTFENNNGNTKLTMNMIFESATELQRLAKEFGAIEGAEQHLARLKHYLSTL
jgi:uncharacterized protein YndB with AHSA1/START domain